MFRFDKSSSQQQSVYQSKQMEKNNKMFSSGALQQKPSNFIQQRSSNIEQEMSANNTQRKSLNKFETKDQVKQTSRSPYRPKLVQHLIDSSDQDNESFMSDQDNNSFQQDQYEQQQRLQEPQNSNKFKFENRNNNHQESMGKSFFTNRTQQTALSKATKVSKTPTQILNTKKVSNNFVPNNDCYSSSSLSFLSQNDKKPTMQIKYDTLKLSQCDKNEANYQNELYLKNRRQFQQNLQTTKIKLSQQLYRSNLFESNKQNQNIVCVDSLQEMKMNQQQKKNNFERKLMINSTVSMDKSYAIRSVSEIIKNESLVDEYEQELNLSRNQSKVQQLNLQLKRSKDVIKTLTLKNTHLQKTLEMQTVQLQQLQSQKLPQAQEQQRRKLQQTVSKTLYERINQYMRVTIKQFMQDVKDIKMSHLLQQNLQQFMTELLQIDSYSVNKKLGISNTIRQNVAKKESQTQEKSEKISAKINKLIKDSSLCMDRNFIQEQEKVTNKNQFKTTCHQTNQRSTNARSNAFMSNQVDTSTTNGKIKGGATVKLDLSSNKENYPSNKENITPNKKAPAEQEFRLLQKSLQKLKNMQKQLQSASPAPKLSTPVPKRQTAGLRTKYRFQTNQDYDEQRSQYSLINRRQFSTINDNSQMNVSGANLDRSKSRRKKIFA